MKSSLPNFIVGIGGSAGALNAYKALFEALAPDTGMAFVIISHIHPAAHSYLKQILARHTEMPALLAANAMPIRANHVYVIPANADLTVEGNSFKVVSPRSKRGNLVYLFFMSLAEAMGARAIGVVFSGYENDGTKGCQYIKAKGGVTFSQDASAEVGSMPRTAHASGYVDFVLPPGKIPEELRKLGSRPKVRSRST